jgi:protocatechuate 3,4-dioxygenase beta subunit
MHYDRTLIDRRNALRLLAGAGFFALAGCASSKTSLGASSTTTTTSGTSGTTDTTNATDTSTDCGTSIPEETAGPFPGDGSNGPDALHTDGIVRRDITKSFGGASGTAEGVPTTIRLTLLDTANGCKPYAGAAVYLWHASREGEYSQYGNATAQNYLRGVQVADKSGVVEFTSVFPACYDGRWPHIHFEIYENEAAATGNGSPRRTTQLALPEDACNTVYATSGYESSASNLDNVTLQSDMVFSDDGAAHQIASVTGSVDKGYNVALTVPV